MSALPSIPPAAPSLAAGLAELSPACFGIVMATGIVSMACAMLGLPALAEGLFDFNIAVYLLLWLLTVARAVRHGRRFLADLTDHARGPGFFTAVAATGVLGSQFVVLHGDTHAGLLLWLLSFALWMALTYSIFPALTVKEDKPTLDRGISGSWLLAVVATQAIAVLGALLATRLAAEWRPVLAFLALSAWLCAGMLYIWVMSLIFFRYTFFRLSPADLAPPYWINMGAMAISTLAGSLLVLAAPELPLLNSLQPFLKGFTVFYWATGTWWIPMLLVLGVWRHIWRRFPLRYDPLYWGAVFPLGMYTASTHEMIDALSLDFLGFLPQVFLYAALAAWLLAFVGLLADLWQRLAAASLLPGR